MDKFNLREYLKNNPLLKEEAPKFKGGNTFIEDNPAIIELPSSVVLTVTDSPEGVKGDSTTNVMKTITLETGKKIQAPLFIKTGERLKVDTREGKYMERVNK